MHELKNLAVLTLPGLHGAGPDHWQTAWEAAFPGLRRLQHITFQPIAIAKEEQTNRIATLR